MSVCEYAFYKDNEKFYPHLYCKVDEKWCHYVKRCEKVEKFIPVKDNVWEECGKYIMEKRKNIPNGSYFIQTTRPNRQGKLFLYVVIDDKVERILSDFTEIKQNYIYLKKNNQGYEISLEPLKKAEKENITIHINDELVTERKRNKKRTKPITKENE